METIPVAGKNLRLSSGAGIPAKQRRPLGVFKQGDEWKETAVVFKITK